MISLQAQKEKLMEKISYLGMIDGVQDFKGVRRIGTSTIHNSPLASDQFAFALILSQHPLVLRSLDDDFLDAESFDANPLRDAKVLEGMRILDLGCGYEPTFARSTRYLGADTFTADIIPASDLRYRSCMDESFLSSEDANHIELDLGNPDALERLLDRTGGRFDLVTLAHLDTGTMYKEREMYGPGNIQEIAFELLKKGGVYYKSQGWSSRPLVKGGVE